MEGGVGKGIMNIKVGSLVSLYRYVSNIGGGGREGDQRRALKS